MPFALRPGSDGLLYHHVALRTRVPARVSAMVRGPRIPDVSVIIPARNRPELLRRALKSVQSQVGVDAEVIVIDDASEVPLKKAVGLLASKNVRFERNVSRRNAAYSRNRGACLARSDVLAFLDSDDIWFPDHLRRALACLANKDQNVLYVSRFGSKERLRSDEPAFYQNGYQFLFDRVGDPRSSALVVRKSFFEEVEGFDPHLEKYQDWDFALRCAEKGKLVLGSSTTVYLDELAEDRMSSRTNLVAAQVFLARHAERMSKRNLSRFFASLLLVAAAQNDPKELRKAVDLWRRHLSLRSFPVRYWALLCCPRIGLVLNQVWRIFRRLQGGLPYLAARSELLRNRD
jgi:glycosyltransferase involved in cell wall biosynthesis